MRTFFCSANNRELGFGRNLNPSGVLNVRMFSIAALAVLVLLVAPTVAKSDSPAEDALRAKVRELEERLARIEKQLAVPAHDTIPFSDVVVNLKDDRQQRYLRIKITLRVDESAHRSLESLVAKKKAEMKNAAIMFLADQTIKDVSGTKGVENVQESLKKAFGEILARGAKNPIKAILFEEYIVQ